MLLAASSMAGDVGIVLGFLGIGYMIRAAGRLAFNNPEKTATCLKVARTFLKK